MSKIRTTLASAVAILSLVAGGVALVGHSSPRPDHNLAGPAPCCVGDGTSA
jgi:hypothetical protein